MKTDSCTLTELRDWLLSAGDEWAGEGVLTVIYRMSMIRT